MCFKDFLKRAERVGGGKGCRMNSFYKFRALEGWSFRSEEMLVARSEFS